MRKNKEIQIKGKFISDVIDLLRTAQSHPTRCLDKQGRKRVVKSVSMIISDKLMVRASWHNKPSGNNSQEHIVVTYGRLNAEEVKYRKSFNSKRLMDMLDRPIYRYKYYPL